MHQWAGKHNLIALGYIGDGTTQYEQTRITSNNDPYLPTSTMKHHMSSVQNPGWLGYIGHYTAHLYGDCNKPI